MLDCIGLLGPNKSLWLYCSADDSETYNYDDFPTGTYRWSLRGLRWLDEGEIFHVQKNQVLNTRGLRRLKYDEAPQMYALAWLVESNSSRTEIVVGPGLSPEEIEFLRRVSRATDYDENALICGHNIASSS